MSFLHIQRRVIRKRVKHTIIAGVPKEDLVLLQFSNDEINTKLRWKHEKEFEYNGHMYDIVETYSSNGYTSYWCWSDDEETQLNKQLKALLPGVLGKDPGNQQKNQLLIQFAKQLFYQSTDELQSAETKHSIFGNGPEKLLKHLKFSPPSPPPQLLLA